VTHDGKNFADIFIFKSTLQTTQRNDDKKESENVLVVGQKNQVLLRQIKVRLYGQNGVV
jgi:hypothetical protein